MLLFCAFAGLLVGILLNWAVDFLPRYAAHPPTHLPAPRFEFGLGRLVVSWLRRSPNMQSDWLSATVEIIMVLLAIYLGARFGVSVNLWLYVGGFVFLILVALIDFKYRLVLNVMILPAMILTLVVHWLTPGTNWLVVLLGGLFGWVIFAGVAFLRPGELGAGDVKLATLIGLGLGFPNVIWGLLVGVVAGGVTAIILIKHPGFNRKSEMPYAPFLSFGAMMVLFFNPWVGFLW